VGTLSFRFVLYRHHGLTLLHAVWASDIEQCTYLCAKYTLVFWIMTNGGNSENIPGESVMLPDVPPVVSPSWMDDELLARGHYQTPGLERAETAVLLGSSSGDSDAFVLISDFVFACCCRFVRTLDPGQAKTNAATRTVI
jgi:hypothetical protein